MCSFTTRRNQNAYAAGYFHRQHEGNVDLTFSNGAQWVYMTEPEIRKITLKDGGTVNLLDADVQEMLHMSYPGETLTLADSWSELADPDKFGRHQIAVIDELKGSNGVFRMDLHPEDHAKTDIVYIKEGSGCKPPHFRHNLN